MTEISDNAYLSWTELCMEKPVCSGLTLRLEEFETYADSNLAIVEM